MDKLGAPKQQGKRRPSQQIDIDSIAKQTGLEKYEVTDLYNQFIKFDPGKTGIIQKHEIDDVLRDQGIKMNEDKFKLRLKEELDKKNVKKCDLLNLAELYKIMKQFQEEEEESDTMNAEYLDAFVALGGNIDRSGYVLKQRIIDVLKNEFELPLQFEDFLQKLGSSITFSEFVMLFESGAEDTKSRASLVSIFSQKEKNNKSLNGSFHVRYKDFERWDEKNQ